MLLRPYQDQAIKSLWECWRNNPESSPLICIPTGGGKSLVLSTIIKLILEKKPNFKVLVVTHVKELIEQNANEFYGLTKIRPSLFSAGLREKHISNITFGGIQSLYKISNKLNFDLLIVDEAHLISSNDGSMYQQLITGLRKNNNKLKILGLTATPFRLDSGSLIGKNKIFSEIAYDCSIRELIDRNYLCTLLSYYKKPVDLTEVKTSGYDYNQIDLERAFNRQELIKEQIKEIVEVAKEKNRKSWLIFCTGVEHAKEVCLSLNQIGVKAEYVTGDMAHFERESKLRDFKQGKITAICNVGVLTTGFNHPDIDLLVLLRATKSAALYIQMVGRGTRFSSNKSNCIVLDYGGNIERHGPIDSIQVRSKKNTEKVLISSGVNKKCPRCSCAVASRVLICPSCEFPFPDSTIQLDIASSDAKILSEIEEYEVKELNVKLHKKTGSPPMVKIEFVINPYKTFYDFLCFEHQGFASREACRKWVKYTGEIPPKETDSALARAHEIKKISTVKVKKAGKYWQVIDFTN